MKILTSIIDLSNYNVDIPMNVQKELEQEEKELEQDYMYYDTVKKPIYDAYFQIDLPEDKTFI